MSKENAINQKRGQNQGSVYQRRSDGRWVAQVTLQGKHHLKYFSSQPEAAIGLSQTLLQLRQGLPITGSRVPLTNYFASWVEIMSLSLRPKTWIQYQQVINQHILPSLGKLLLQELRPEQIHAFYQLKQREGASGRALGLINCILHHALEHAVKTGILVHNPIKAIPKFKRHFHEQRVWTRDQVREFLQGCRGNRWEALFCLAVTTGMREGELLGLKWMDIRWEKGEIQIQRQRQRIPGQGLVFSQPKTASSRRNVSLGEGMVVRLRAHADLQEQERNAAGNNWRENSLVFPTPLGTPTDPRNLYRIYKGQIQQAGLPDIRFHDLRHTAATLMLGWGIHPKVAQERLGHARISHTLGTYSHVLPSIQAEAAQKMDQLILSPPKGMN